MGKTYAIADIHGRLDLLLEAYNAITMRNDPGRVVHLGDYVDRGKQSRAVIEVLMSDDVIPRGCKRVILKGNHEAIMVETIMKPLNPEWWISNGGDATLLSYGHPEFVRKSRGSVFPYRPDVVPVEHLRFLDDLPATFCDKHRVYVHACVDEELSLPEQKEMTLLWGLRGMHDERGYRGAHVVHGHHEHDKPLLLSGRTNLDVGAYRSGRLAIGVFDDEIPGGPVDIMEVRE